MTKRRFQWCFVLVLLSMSVFTACGDDDDDNDDDDGDDDWHGQGDDDSDDDDDQTPGSCLDYAETFFGTAGCFPDEDLYASTVSLCVELSHSDNEALGEFFACLNQIDCGDYQDVLALYDDIQACQETLAK